ncbi:endonuclease-reverse transcriptase [Plakobranchus ocellatus]|uniref:Endonuclease-reverse transcriptase n=1 Tax=Plakobranchus ocellatus TaxID=259542 RepID=A0AAV3Z6C6_9GAST|nr:endonuclease-reverse transcriptase [Plakobranchus ocellatus]
MEERRKSKNVEYKYKDLNRNIKIKCNAAKEEWINQQCQEIEQKLNIDSKFMHAKIKDVSGKNIKCSSPGWIKSKDKTMLMGKNEILNRWSDDCLEIRKRTQLQDIVDFVAKQKWKWAGHVARLKDNRWTLRVTEWQPRNGKRSRGRQARRWRDDIVKKKGNTWCRDARDRNEWRRDAEGYILQWMDRAS